MSLPTPYYEEDGIVIYNADCRDVLPHLPKVDLVLTDPPYGTTECAWDAIIPFPQMWDGIAFVSRTTTPIILTASQPFTTQLIASNMGLFKYCLVWDKDRSCGSMLAKKRPLKYHEDICIFYGNQPVYNPQMTAGVRQNKAAGGKSENYGDIPVVRYESDLYYPRSIQRFKACHNMTGKVHPTQKPVALMEYLINTYTDDGGIVLDFTMGSGTTLVAAKQLGRKAIGIELEEKYCEIAVQRLRQGVLAL